MVKTTSSCKQEKSEFDLILSQAVHEGLNSIGSTVLSAILPYLKKDGSIGKEGVVNDPEIFDESLTRIFGFGAKVIEKKILEILYIKLQIDEKVESGFNFPEEIRNVQKMISSTKLRVLMSESVNI